MRLQAKRQPIACFRCSTGPTMPQVVVPPRDRLRQRGRIGKAAQNRCHPEHYAIGIECPSITMRILSVRRLLQLFVFLAFIVPCASMVSAQTVEFVDWTSQDSANRTISGMLGTTPVTFSWTSAGIIDSVAFNNESTLFSSAAFTPALASADGVGFVGRLMTEPVPTYSIHFAVPVMNPVVHIGSNASTLTFIGAVPQRVSGDARFSVSGNQVIGSIFDNPNGTDANGTVRFNGLFSSLSFTAQYSGPTSRDAIGIQVGTASVLTLVGLEVVQVVQDWMNTVPLVADRRAVIRAHLEDPLGSNKSLDYTFLVRGFGGPGLDEPLSPPSHTNGTNSNGQSLTLPVDADLAARARPDASATFYVPSPWLAAGPKRFVFEFPGLTGTCGDKAPPVNDDCSVTVAFKQQETMVVNLLRTALVPNGGVPNRAELLDRCKAIKDRFPAKAVDCVIDPNPIAFPANDVPAAKDILKAVQKRKVYDDHCFWFPCKTFYLAITTFDSPDEYVGYATFPADWNASSRSAWATVGSIDAMAAPHELGHTLDLHHTTRDYTPHSKIGTCGEQAAYSHLYPPNNSSFFPFYSGAIPLLGPLGDEHAVIFGFRESDLKPVPHDHIALMSYCQPRQRFWPDVGSYDYMFSQLAADVSSLGVTPPANTAQYFVVSGMVDVLLGTAEMDPVEVLVPALLPTPPQGEFALVADYATGPAVAHPVVVSYSPNEPSIARFSGLVAFDARITGFSLQRDGEVLAQIVGSVSAPTIEIVGPAPGTVLAGAELSLAWAAVDLDGDDLRFVVEYSPDGGVTWATLSSNWPGSPFEIDSELLQPSANGLLRVTALDGFNRTSATLDGTIAIVRSLIHEDGFE